MANILKITLNPSSHLDKWLWIEETNGKFSMKSAYQLLTKEKWLVLGESLQYNLVKFFR